ncbi:FecR domain-containing protein [Methyloradius palustris]|uniref:Sensor n=1 Tax=Methyloradius palustris TaxID=2778876 RepID=A0A8D5JVW9_9PROT|nr:FecR family protein [Methyloradius palustris]BCM24524.1 sensor [Methyloradius palustris]
MNSNNHSNIPDVIKEAASWLSKMHRGPLSHDEEVALAEWRIQSELHEMAWKNAEQLNVKLKKIPNRIGMMVLDRPTSLERRAFIKPLAIFMIAAPTGLLTYRMTPWQSWTADYSTAIGETKTYALADGTKITLNTDSAVDIDYDNQHRYIKLYKGEVYVETAKDQLHRPLAVLTKHGRLTALGTVFTVRLESDFSSIAVMEGAVEVVAKESNKSSVVIPALNQSTFSSTKIDPILPLDPNASAWIDGTLYADNMRLEDFIGLLSRYRKGVLTCDETSKNILISGAFQLKDPEHILEMIQDTRPIKIIWRTRYWGSITKN